MIAAPILEPHRYSAFPAEREMLAWLLQLDPQAWCGQYSTVVEIGAYEGETTEYLYRHCGWRPMVVIDPWDGTQDGSGQDVYARFLARMHDAIHDRHAVQGHDLVKPPLQVWRVRSQEATIPDNLGFVFHDGDHREPDFQKWYDALIPGGVLVIHDFHEDAGWPMVRDAAEALGPPWHEYRYRATLAEHQQYGPSTRGLLWKVKPRD